MHKTKLNKIWNIIESIKNDISLPIISDFLEWFYEKLDIHFNKNDLNLKLNKWDIVFVNLWKNIWSELNKTRPCIVYSDKKANFWNTVIILPLKSYKWKIVKDFNVFVDKKEILWLEKSSIVDLSSMRQISKKRINKKIWKVWKDILKEIDYKILNLFWIKNKE